MHMNEPPKNLPWNRFNDNLENFSHGSKEILWSLKVWVRSIPSAAQYLGLHFVLLLLNYHGTCPL